MDSPKRSLKGVTEGNPIRCCFPWSQSWELHAALLVPVFQELIRNRESLRNSTQNNGRKQRIGSLKVERPLTLCNPMECLVHEILQVRILDCIAFPFSRGSSQPSDWTEVSALWEDYLPAEPQGKPQNTGMGSLSLLQQIFSIQELNQGLLHCRWILYQLTYQGSPEYTWKLR